MKRRKTLPNSQTILTEAETEALLERLRKGAPTTEDLKIFEQLIDLNRWLYERLSKAKLSLKKLRELFGFRSEKRSRSSDSNDASDSDNESDDSDKSASPNPTDPPVDQPEQACPAVNDPAKNSGKKEPVWDEKANHGRYGVDKYTGCETISVDFDDPNLKEGLCPLCLECNTKSRLDKEPPKVTIFLEGSPLIAGYRVERKQARCSVCRKVFVADMPKDFASRPKYDATCYTTIAIHHYYGGVPFKRLETLQSSQGIALADSTQSDLMKEFYHAVIKRVVEALYESASDSNLMRYDDTPGRILEQSTINGLMGIKSNTIHTTAMVCESELGRIYLFKTNEQTAGKEFASLLSGRFNEDDFISMTDASSSNFPYMKEGLMAKWIIALCMAHSRRRFVRAFDGGDSYAGTVLNIIGLIYKNDAHCKSNNMTSEERLAYHQIYSEPLMNSLRLWLNNLILFKQVEPNSEMGQSIGYLLKRWDLFTQFLKVAGAPLDNNICEQAVKVAIRYIKNSLFYRTFQGAEIGDGVMSLCHTAAHAKINLFDYLNTLQANEKDVNADPHSWLPWNYQDTLSKKDINLPKKVNDTS